MTHLNDSVKRPAPVTQPPPPPYLAAAGYKECLKNHAAGIGGYAVDGCGEFMPASTYDCSEPTSLKCAACGCHRNFHRREQTTPRKSTRAAPPLPPPLLQMGFPSPSSSTGPGSCSIQSPESSPSPPHQPGGAHDASATQILLALGNSYPTAPPEHLQPGSSIHLTELKTDTPCGKKRSRTKFSREQKEMMFTFSEKLGWKMQRAEEAALNEFCTEVGVSRYVFKVWMHNNKNRRLDRSAGDISGPRHDSISFNFNGEMQLKQETSSPEKLHGSVHIVSP